MTQPNLRLVDCCVNLKDEMFQGIYHGKQKHAPDFHLILERARENGVDTILGVSGSLQDSIATVEVARSHPGIYATVGVHPTRAGELEASPDPDAILDQLAALAADKANKVVAIGEIGLDYDRLEFCPKDVQLRWFE
eukprot:CAMPEP_0172164004 /NCGR_PEP_ID=MMETSP1050-20130122/7596_1 /TAXON_ID=233186 /ORGANISM="Cryptomonas curvata, Strain CCAP979/52" /LENGTH=136 /DNA_ID=CAMNT_0012834277 /DNA_START=119 /DNA_END=526 /DNA_ORIENTATION=-